MRHDLLPHQQQAVAYARPRKQIALFMEMRLGKCVVTIRWAKAHGCRRVLVLAPLTTLRGTTQWEGELRREDIQPVVLPNIPKPSWTAAQWVWSRSLRPLRRREGWYLINFEALLHRPDVLQESWDAIIVDESTRIRNPRAQLTKLLMRQSFHIPHRAILSGLPNPESPMDFFCQFQFLHGEFMGYDNYWSWLHRYFFQAGQEWNWLPKRGTRDLIRTYIHHHAFILRRETAGVGSKKVRMSPVVVPMTKGQRKAMRHMRRDYAYAGKETKWATVVHQWMQRLAGGWHPTLDPPELMSDLKMKALAKLCRRHKPVVVWFRFNHEIEACYHYLREHAPQLRVAYVHGEMPDSKRVRVLHQEAFQAGQLDVILIQVKLGRYGWNLSCSDVAIYYSNSYEFEDRSQSEDRIIHVTKRRDCYYIDLVTEGSPDEEVVDAVSTKRLTSRQLTRRVNSSIKKLLRRRAA